MSAAALRQGLGENWSFVSFPEYLDAIARRGTAINVGVLVGHTPVRLFVMGKDATERPARDDEIAAMRDLVAEAMSAGALGFATSTSPLHVGFDAKPVPSRLAAFDEILALASVLKDAGRGVIQIAAGGQVRFEDYVALARASGRPVSWSALMTRNSNPNAHTDQLEKSRELIAQGLPIHPQATCRPLSPRWNSSSFALSFAVSP